MFYLFSKKLMSTLFEVSLHFFKSIISWIQLDNYCLITLTVILWVMQSYHTSPLRCIILPTGIDIPFIKYQTSHKSDQLGIYTLS